MPLVLRILEARASFEFLDQLPLVRRQPRPREEVPLHKQPAMLAAAVLVLTVALNIIFF